MPRNAAKKLNNKEERLPATAESVIQQQANLTITATSDDATQTKSNTQVKAKQRQQRQRQHKKRRLRNSLRFTRSAKNKRKIKQQPRKTKTTLATNAARAKQATLNNTTTTIAAARTTPATLYPIVIEISNDTIPTAVALLQQSVNTNTSNNTTALSTSKINQVAANDSDVNDNANANNQQHIDNTDSTLNKKLAVQPKRKRKSNINNDTAKSSDRLATLRTRKAATVITAATKPNGKAKKTPANTKTSALEKALLESLQQLQQQTNEYLKEKPYNKTATPTSHKVAFHLDAAFLNKIETLEFEEKKPVSKRKRNNSLNNTRKRVTVTEKYCNNNHQNNNNNNNNNNSHIELNKQLIETVKTVLPATELATETLPTNSNNNNNNNNNNLKKRARIMSLYERRYQSNEDGGRGAVVTNGYPHTTRNSSAGSNAAAHNDNADAQDVSNQYFMSSSNASVNTATSLNNSSGNGGNSINHAPTMATLCNIGNTCYLNSVVYTLRFAPHFLHNLHHLTIDLSAIQQNIVRQRAKSSSLGRGVTGVHMENTRSWSSKDLASLEQNAIVSGGSSGSSSVSSIAQKNCHQMLTERLHEVYQSLHRNEVIDSNDSFHADTLLHAIQDVSSIFEGNQQQDAHEFLMCLLNSIRETCQTLIKAIAECPDIIMNGYIPNPDDALDSAYISDRDSMSTGSNQTTSAGGGNGSTTTSSSLSTSNITKGSFFSRKSKRKEEAKNSKNSRLQSPLKDSSSGSGGGGGNSTMQPQQQTTSNSLFYLNTVDLSGANTQAANTSANAATTTTTATTVGAASSVVLPSVVTAKGAALINSSSGASGDVVDAAAVSLLKDKERLAEKIRELGLDFFSEDFEGVTVSTTKCLSCETITEQKESMIDIAVPVPISGYESADYTERPSSFIQNSCITREYFRGENKYRCEQCTGYTEAIRSISYEVLPRLLVIQLSRFSGGMEKINSYVPTSFTLQCFCSKCCELGDANKLHIYKLYSVITHVGATMSVGHYIAYTCSLDFATEYTNCPKDRRTNAQYQQQQAGNAAAASVMQNNGMLATEQRSSLIAPSAASAAASVLASSGTSLMKKMKFGRSKASSSGDMSKNMKNLNGLTSKAITNGIGKLSMNTTCHSLNCCSTRYCKAQQQQQQLHQQQNASNSQQDFMSGSGGSGGGDESMANGISGLSNQSGISTSTASFNSVPTGYGSTGRGGYRTSYNASSNTINSAEPVWYMCDDDKIKAMSQREFEDILSPSRKLTVTPYLLFYARFNLQPTVQPTPPKQPTATAGSSWSNESLQSGGATVLHKI